MTKLDTSVALPSKNLTVGLLLTSGVIASAQIGKAIIAIPQIRAEMELSFGMSGVIVATFATIGASFGMGAGVIARKIGLRRSLIAGMTTIAIGNLVGGFAPNELVLLVSRIIEGIGFFGVAISIPSMLAEIVETNRRDFVMALWSAYMPAGITLMLAIAPIVVIIGWRTLWFLSACVADIAAILLLFATPTVSSVNAPRSERAALSDVALVLRDPLCLSLALAFFAYSCQIFSMTFALPQLLTSRYGVSLGQAGVISATVLTVSTFGHLASSFLLRAGVPIWANIAAAFLFFSLSSLPVYASASSLPIVLISAAMALGVGGLAPGALYASAPQAAPNKRSIPLAIGLLQQASNLGQFAGPVALALWVDSFGWVAAPVIVTPAALFGLAIAFSVRGLMVSLKRNDLIGQSIPR
jgi:predicted MFS family arabinose efflux permease